MAKHSDRLGTQPIKKLLLRLSMPAITGMLVQATYNIVDTIFVGNGVGVEAIGGMAIVFPIQVIIMAIGIGFGIGGASLISRSLGAKNKELASDTLGTMIASALGIGIAFMVVSALFSGEILQLFGAQTPLLMKYAEEYFSVILWGIPLISFAVCTNNAVRAEGRADIAMVTMLVGALLNIILDPLFIFVLGMGVQGAAFATVFAQLATSTYLFIYLQSGKSELHLSLKRMRIKLSILKEITKVGSASFMRQAAGSLMATILNHSLVIYGGDIGVAFFGVAFRLLSLIMMPVFGISQGFQPIAGYNYGAQQYDRVQSSYRLAVIWASIISSVGTAAIVLFPGPILSIFGKSGENLNTMLEMGIPAARTVALLMPLVGFQITAASLFQALGKAMPAMILTISRQFLFLIPLILILPKYYGLAGIWWSFPISDALSVLITYILARQEMRKLKVSAISEMAFDSIKGDTCVATIRRNKPAGP